MSFTTGGWRTFARSGRVSGDWRGLIQTDINDVTGTTVINRGQVGTVIYRSKGVYINRTITGVTRDSNGVALGNCAVHLILTDVDTIAQETSSDASGNFTFFNPGSGPFYIVAYKVGAPDIAGTTVNKLIGV